jgi:hypothetical protein
VVHNRGIEPTFRNAANSSIIDVTITFPRTRVGERHVMSRPTMSDHRCVSFVLDSRNQGVIPAGRNYFKADWTKFNSDMNVADSWSTNWSRQKIEERVKTFYSRLNTALDNACPKSAAKENK